MKIYCICHGESVDDQLLAIGEKQAARAGWALKELGLRPEETRLIASPTKRTMNTAAIIGSTIGIGSVVTAEWLGEEIPFVDFGKGLEPFMRRGGLKQIVLVGHGPVFRYFLYVYDAGLTSVKSGEVYEVNMETDEVRKLL